jgi:hypothetical protein
MDNQDFIFLNIKNGGLRLSKYSGKGGHVVIPSEVDGKKIKKIMDNAFSNCENLISVVIPEGVTVIGNEAFNWCSNLEKVVIPESVVAIGEYAFAHCYKLADLTIPDVVCIGARAFYCTDLDPCFCHIADRPLFLAALRRGQFFHTGEFEYPITIIEGQVAIGCQAFSYEEWMGGKLFEIGVENEVEQSDIAEFQPKLEKMYLDFIQNLAKVQL